MHTLTLHLNDTIAQCLANEALLRNLSPENIIIESLEIMNSVQYSRHEHSLERGIEYVLQKNRAFFQRLA
jgi:hypothetical protein